MFKSVFVRKVLVLLLSVAVIGIYSFGSTASLFAEAGTTGGDSSTATKIDRALSSYTNLSGNWVIVKQSTFAILWTREAVDQTTRNQIIADAQAADGSLRNTQLKWYFYSGFNGSGSSNPYIHPDLDSNSETEDTNVGYYVFSQGSNGTVSLNIYSDKNCTAPAAKISHLVYGKYILKGCISVTKSLVNGSDFSGTVYFKLLNSNGEQVGTLKSLTFTNGATTDKAAWSNVEYGQYTVVETNASGTALTAGSTVAGKKLVIISNNNSTPVTLNSATATATVTNTFEGSKAKLSFGVEKQLSGRSFKTGDAFTFALFRGTSATGTPLDTVTTDATSGNSQKLTFNDIEFGQVGTFYYTVVEQVPSETNGVEYSSEVYKIKVVVTINGSGNYVATPTITNSKGTETSMVFVNKYDAQGSATINVNKTLNGRALENGEFSFEMVQVDSEGNAITGKTWTATNDANGKVDFGNLEYDLRDAGKTYTYKISEVVPEGAVSDNVKYDTTVHTVTVVVGTDQGDGTLSASQVTYETGSSVEFTNVYGASGSAALEASKVLKTKTGEDKALEAGDYSFSVYEEGSETALETVSNDADGKVAFTAFDYQLSDLDGATSKDFTYLIKENKGSAAGVTYDTTTYKAVVTVTNDGTDQLETEVKYYKGTTEESSATFNNVYNAKGSAVISVSKTLTGKDLAAGDYTFRLVQVDENNSEIAGTAQTATNAADGTVDFAAINYDLGDAGNTYTYKVTEVIPEGVVNGIGNNTVYDTSAKYITVTVGTDQGDGTLSDSVVNYPETGVEFSNTYGASGSVTLEAGKTLTNKTLTDNAFAFTVYVGNTSEVATFGKNTADGTIVFAPIYYTLADLGGAQSKTFTYTIKEDGGTAGGITYSDLQYTAVVTVVNNGTNVLDTSVVYYLNGVEIDKASFENQYNARGSAEISVSKTLTGKDLEAGDYTFRLVQVDADNNEIAGTAQTAANAADGTVDFAAIDYDLGDAGKTYTYKVTEVIPEGVVNGIGNNTVYDTSTKIVTVTVGTDQGDGTLSDSVVNYPETGVEFSNTYGARGSATIAAAKTLENKDLEEGEFTFSLFEEGNDTAIATATNDAVGNIVFPEIEYTLDDLNGAESKEFTYTIKEEAGTIAGITYDSATYTAVVTVTNDGSDVLQTIVDYSELTADSEVPVFDNVYNASGSADIQVNKTLEGKDLTAGEFNFRMVQVDAEGNEIAGTAQTATNAADGTVDFAALNYGLSDADQNYTYKITEVIPEGVVNGVGNNTVYDTSEKYVTVYVGEDNGDGTIDTTVDYGTGDEVEFNNTYGAEGSIVLTAGKSLEGGELIPGEFNFGLYTKDGTTAISEASNDADGNIAFSPLTYTLADLGGAQSKTFAYEIKEIVPQNKAVGMAYDTTLYRAVVTVTNDGSNVLHTSVVYQDANGDAIDGTPTFVNSLKLFTSVDVVKVWDDSDNQYGERPDDITVHLLRNGVVVDSQILNEDSNWSYSWSELPKYDGNGQQYVYSVSEDAVTDYVTLINGGGNVTGDNYYFEIINTFSGYKGLYVNRTVHKVWNDDNNSSNTRPAKVMVQLYANGEAVGDPVEVTAAKDWKYTWKELPASTKDGSEIEYTVKEISVTSGYTASYSADTFTITNTKGGGGGGDNPGTYNSGPRTGDTSDLMMQLMILGMAMTGLGGALYVRRRSQSEE
jgi:pilin isopeptide linkage protein